MFTYPSPLSSVEVTRYVAYSRVSSRNQADGHASLALQQLSLSSYAENSSAIIVGSFQDVLTGRHTAHSRPGLQAAIERCVNARASLLVASVDRLGRSLDLVDCLERNGIEVVSVEEGFVSRESRLTPLLKKAEEYSKLISKNSRAAASRCREAGGRLGNMQNLEAHRRRGTLTNQARSEAKIETLAAQLRDHPELLGMTLGQRVAWLNERGVHNQLSLYTVPVSWTAGALRKPFKAALAQVQAEEKPPQT